jgi:hypothetical protein
LGLQVNNLWNCEKNKREKEGKGREKVTKEKTWEWKIK